MNIHIAHQKLLETYLTERKTLGASVQSLRNDHSRIPHLLSYLEESGLNAQSLDITAARGFMEHIASRGTVSGNPYRKNTLASYKQAASRFSRWMRDSGLSLSDPFTTVPALKTEKIIPRNLPSERQLMTLLSHLEVFNSAGSLKMRKRRYLTHVIAELLYSTGLRISEASDLIEEDLDLDRKEIYIRQGKGGRDRKAFLNDYAASILREYLLNRDQILTAKSNGEKLFGASHDELGKAFNRNLKKACREVGIPELTAHSLRHCLGYHLLKSGAPLRQIQQILGHKSISNTEIYTKVDVKEVKDQLDKFHPRKWRDKD